MAETGELLWAPRAWVGGRWRERVVLESAARPSPDGLRPVGQPSYWRAITPDQPCPAQATPLAGPVLPGLVDAHSHAFQRAFVGHAETLVGAHDDFWSWRDRMYGVALKINVEQLRAVAAHVYAELLAGGYTQVCEFHYLQHAPNGTPYADPATLAWAVADGAQDAGIGLTMLPVVYERAGFEAPALRPDQRRFATTAASVLALQRDLAASRRPMLEAGVAIHSLRAARPESITAIARGATGGPVHIHIAEQTAEVEDCLSTNGLRPIDWLNRHVRLDARWHLVHATHTVPAEIDAVARTGAGVVLCPGTEANLGDGLADLPGWLQAGVPLTIGSDSQVVREWPEELRWLEYGQRLGLRRRNVAANPAGGQSATAARLFDAMLAGSPAAAGLPRWGLVPGARADLLVLNRQDPALQGVPDHKLLDALVFAAPARPFRDVMVAGRWRVRSNHHLDEERLTARFVDAMRELQ